MDISYIQKSTCDRNAKVTANSDNVAKTAAGLRNYPLFKPWRETKLQLNHPRGSRLDRTNKIGSNPQFPSGTCCIQSDATSSLAYA